MKSSKLFLIGILLLVVTGGVVYGFISSTQKAAQEAEQAALEEAVAVAPKQLSKVVVVKQDITARSVLTAEMIDIQERPAEYIHPMAILNIEDAINKLTLVPLNAGEQLLQTKIADPDTDYLSYILREGYVAYTVAISEMTTAAGMVRVGDKIHVMGEFSAGIAGEDIIHFVLTDIPILAIGQDLSINTSPGAGNFSTMTLELLPEQAQQLAWSQSHGSLNFILTSVLSDEENSNFRAVTGRDVLGNIPAFQLEDLKATIQKEMEVFNAVKQMTEYDPDAVSGRIKDKVVNHDLDAYNEEFFEEIFNYEIKEEESKETDEE